MSPTTFAVLRALSLVVSVTAIAVIVGIGVAFVLTRR